MFRVRSSILRTMLLMVLATLLLSIQGKERILFANPQLQDAHVYVFENLFESDSNQPWCVIDGDSTRMDQGIPNVKINHWAMPYTVWNEKDTDMTDPAVMLIGEPKYTDQNGHVNMSYSYEYLNYLHVYEVAGTLIVSDTSNFGPGGGLADYTEYPNCDSFAGHPGTTFSQNSYFAMKRSPTGVYVYEGEVFNDGNRNGIQEGGESGIADVRVDFWGTDDGSFDPAHDDFLGYAVTDSTGEFQFIPDAYYYLVFAHVSATNPFLTAGYVPSETDTLPILTDYSFGIYTNFGYYQASTPTPVLPTPLPKTPTPAHPPFPLTPVTSPGPIVQ